MTGYHGDGEFDLHYDPKCPQCTARRDRLMPDHGMDAVYEAVTPSGTPDREPEENNMTDTLPFPTTDASRWAAEFVRLHGGDEGLMLAWFANAIEHGRGPSGTPDRERLCAVCGKPVRIVHAPNRGYHDHPADLAGVHPAAPSAAEQHPTVRQSGIDVEALARAMHEAYEYEADEPVLPFRDDADTFWTPFARTIAREYQRIIEEKVKLK